MGQCNCENLHCAHHSRGVERADQWMPCQNDADGSFRAMYIGAVCRTCYFALDERYRLSTPKPTPYDVKANALRTEAQRLVATVRHHLEKRTALNEHDQTCLALCSVAEKLADLSK